MEESIVQVVSGPVVQATPKLMMKFFNMIWICCCRTDKNNFHGFTDAIVLSSVKF